MNNQELRILALKCATKIISSDPDSFDNYSIGDEVTELSQRIYDWLVNTEQVKSENNHIK